VSGKNLAKVVIVKVNGCFIMIVLPSNYLINLDVIANALDVKDAQLASEKELQSLFPDCEVGAMPVFGNLYGLSVYIDNTLFEAEELIFEAGNHHEVIKIAYRDFEMLVRPEAIDLIQHTL
jgi:Ala-tRNA(Pro) deacylase